MLPSACEDHWQIRHSQRAVGGPVGMRSSRALSAVGMAIIFAAVTAGCTNLSQDSATPSPTPSPSPPARGAELVGDWVATGDPTVTLTLNADGTVVGFDGCNSQSGNWSGPSGGYLGLEFTMHTDAGCPEGVVPWLGGSDGAIVDGGALTLFGPTDIPTGELVRAED